MRAKQSVPALVLGLLISGTQFAGAQAVPSAYGRTFRLTAGALGSAFQPDYQGGGVPGSSSNYLVGPGVYVDLHFSRWLGAEAEGRWLRFNQYADIHQDNYLLGYRLSLSQVRIWNFTPYGKVLAGYGRMNFEYNDAHGRFSDIVYGGGLDMHTAGRWTFRPIDFEYQQWPNWLGTTLHPWGFTAGIGWRILGR
jgi:hypothetical protein